MVALRVLLSVLFERCGIARGGVLPEGEWLRARAHLAVADLGSRLECLIWFERLLEVHPVLRRIAELLLHTPKEKAKLEPITG